MSGNKRVFYLILLLVVDLCIHVSCNVCVHQCPAVSTSGWFSALMVCDVGSRNTTIMWRRDESTVNASYVVLYEDSIGNQMRSDSIRGDEEMFTYVIRGLAPETDYEVQVCQPELNVCGNCTVMFTTPAAEEHSGPPVDLAIFVLGPTTLTVNWSAPRLYPDVVISYIIRCAQQDDDSNFVETSRVMTRFDATFRDLIPNTTYNCEVYTTSMFGNSTAARDSASTFPRETVPGVMLFVSQNVIRYARLTESSLEMFFTFLDDVPVLLDENQVTANISGVDYHFHREELYIALSNGSIVQYILSVSAHPNGDLIISIVPPPVLLYTAMEGNVLGAIAVDWLFNDMYWIEFEGSEAKVNRMDLASRVVVCEVTWGSRSIDKIAVDPVHGYFYWSVHGDFGENGLFRGPLDDFRDSQISLCPTETPSKEVVFLSPTLVDFVLEPDVFVYFITDNTVHYIGFDKQNNGSIIPATGMLVESFGEHTVSYDDMLSLARTCNAETGMCSAHVEMFSDISFRDIDDILVFRKAKQPLPAPPSYPSEVRVFSGSESATIMWEMPGFVQSFFGSSAYDDWEYCVNYTTFGGLDVTSECTNDLQIILSPLEGNTLYTFVVTASGPGGGKTTPNKFLFQTKPAGSATARLLISTDDAVMLSNLDGSDSQHVSEQNEIRLTTRESNGVAYDIRSSLYFWIIEGGQGPLYRYSVTNDNSSKLVARLDTPISLAADWVGRRLFWVQDGMNVADDRQLVSINMDGGNPALFAEDPRVTSIAVDSLNGIIFWITGKDIVAGKLNGLAERLCYSAESEPLALTLDVEGQYLYWMSLNNDDNTVWLNQLNYTAEECGASPFMMSFPGNLFAFSSRGVLTYGLGTLYLTTISNSAQSVYVIPADFPSFASIISESITLAFGVIPQADVVRDICVVSDTLQPLPEGVTEPGLSGINAQPLSSPPVLRESESNTSVIVIEWGESPTSIATPILYEVEYTLTPFLQPTMDPVKEFTTQTSIRLKDQTFSTKVRVTVTPHTLWVQSDESLSVTSVFLSTPMEPGMVVNVRAYVYRPSFDDRTAITALIVWDALNVTEAGGIVDHYTVEITGAANPVLKTNGNESYLVVRQFSSNNTLSYPLEKNMTYNVQVYAVNAGGSGLCSDLVTFSTYNVYLPQELLAITSSQSVLYGNNVFQDSHVAADPVTVNTISRLLYWYNSTLNSIMMQSLDGEEIFVFLDNCPITVHTMAFEWQGERIYMAGLNSLTNLFELWRVPAVYAKDIERVHQLPMKVLKISNLVVDSFRQGRAFWLQEINSDVSLQFLNLNLNRGEQRPVSFPDITVSTFILEPITGDLWVSNQTDGKILKCPQLNESCEEVVDTEMTVSSLSLDEHMIFWTNGSLIASVLLSDPRATPMISDPFEEDSVLYLHTLSPGQQPQFYTCEVGETCLAPPSNAVAMLEGHYNTTPTTIEVWWPLPPLIECCAETVFSYPLAQYKYGVNPEDPFRRHFTIEDLTPFTTNEISLAIFNEYTISVFGNPMSLFKWLLGILTSPGVPDEVDGLGANAFGITCISVSWKEPLALRGPPEDKAYFVTFISGEVSFTMDVGPNNSVSLENFMPGLNYRVEVKVSNGAENSSIVSLEGVMTWPLVPAPEVQQKTNTSLSLTLELGTEHSNVSSIFIQAITNERDGMNQSCCNQDVNFTLPTLLTFNLSGLSAYTSYNVQAVATYVETTCSTNQYGGRSKEIRTNTGIPDSPELNIDSDGVARWEGVNQRTNTGNFSYILEAIGADGETVLSQDVGNTVFEDLNRLMNLRAGQSYNICVTARNENGNSTPSCDSYMPEGQDGRTEEPSSSLPVGVTVAIAIGVALLLGLLVILLGLAVYCWCRRREKKSLARLAYAYGPDLELSSIRAQRYHRTNAGSNQVSMWSRETFVATDEELALLSKFPRKHITLENFLGQGEFGEVFQGTAFDILGVDTGPHPVAIKTFRKGASVEEKHKFLSEAALMGKFDHANIVKILGVCIDNDPVFIIMELMPAGDLLQFLREARPESGPALLTREEQLHITKDIAQGCRYLEQQHFIHRDLAARNCLVSSKGADRIVKIGDFGLARDLYSSDYYRVEGERKLPVRWMAPEGLLQGKFTIESDVWAYGVLLYEIMSFGNQPYPGQSNQDVLQFVTAGGRLPKPDNCPQRIYRLMLMSWRKYASERPRFEEICRYLDTIMEDMKRESYCESDSDEGETLSREGSKRFPTRSPSIKSGFQNLVRSGSKKLRNSLRRHSLHRKEDQTTHTSENGDSFRESGLI